VNIQQTASDKIEALTTELQALPDQLKAVHADRKTKVDTLMESAGILKQVQDLDAQVEGIFKQCQSHADQLQGQIAAWTEVQAHATEVSEAEVPEDIAEVPDTPEDPEEDPEPHLIHGIDVTKLSDHTKYQVMGGNPETIAILKAAMNSEPEEPESDLLDDMDEVEALLEGVRTTDEVDEAEELEAEEFDVEDFLGEEGDGKEETPVESLVQRYRTEGA
jgi:hypothetical protein